MARVKEVAALALAASLVVVCVGRLSVLDSNYGILSEKNAPRYIFSPSNFNLTNATVALVPNGITCEDAERLPHVLPPIQGLNVSEGTVLLVVTPLCFPDKIAAEAHKAGYAAVLVANGIAPATGLWALSLWRTKDMVQIPVVDIRVNLVRPAYKDYVKVNLDSTSPNFFANYAHSGGFIFLLVLAHLTTFVQFCVSLHRMRFQWAHGVNSRNHTTRPGVRSQAMAKLSNVATLITAFHCLGAFFRHLLLGDPFGVYGSYNFPATNWLVFFSTTFSEVATFLLGFSLHRIIAQLEEDFNGGNIRHELKIMTLASVVVVAINLIMTLLNNIAGLPDSFFIVLNLYGIIQVYIFWYFFQNRARVLQQETATATATSNGRKGHREYQMRRSLRLLQAGLVVVTLFVVLFQPLALGVLVLGPCKSGSGSVTSDCSSLLAILVLAVIFMNVSAILQLLSLPGETKLQWEQRTGDRVKSDDLGSGSQVVELDDATPSVMTNQTLRTTTRLGSDG